LTSKHPLDNSQITGNREVIAGQKSACRKFHHIGNDKQTRMCSRTVDSDRWPFPSFPETGLEEISSDFLERDF